MKETWESPRKIEEDKKLYKRKRFESYMGMADRGELSREMAIVALRDEIAYAGELDIDMTQPIDTQAIQGMLFDGDDRETA